MLTEPLPKTLDVRKAAARGVSIQGILKPLDLQRFGELLASPDGVVEVVLEFSRDEENRYLVQVAFEADVGVTCQRCLEAMPARVTGSNTVAVVWTDEEARHLPKHLDPVISEEACNLWDLVEDELILALPPFSYHRNEDCNTILAGLSRTDPVEAVSSDKPNPFDVLAQLKPGKK